MVTRACISINNRCNLNCTYCHFHEKKDYIQEDNMDVITILDIITSHIEDNDIDLFKLGFVGNGEPMLDYEKLKQYIAHIGDYLKSGRIAAYTITNGLLVDREKLEFFKEYNVNVGFSVDGILFWKLLHLLRLTEICTISLFICIVLRKILRKDMLCQRKMLSLLASPLSR